MQEGKRRQRPADPDDRAVPRTHGTPLRALIDRRLSRREVLRGLAVGGPAVALGVVSRRGPAAGKASPSTLTFQEVPHGVSKDLVVAPGYDAEVLIRWGDPVVAGAAEFDLRAQTAAAQAGQFGYNNDFTAYFPLPRDGRASDHGLLVVNHEYTLARLMFPDPGPDRAQRTGIEKAAHGVSVVEIRRTGGRWAVVANSTYGRRVTAETPIAISGPAAGHAWLKTAADPTGTRVTCTLANCAGGVTPWGSVLTAEENFNGYFAGQAADPAERARQRRYGVGGRPRVAWYKIDPRFDLAREPREPNRFGWIVEFDPHDPASLPRKRTALGRMKHEGATVAQNGDGRVVVYCGDDQQFEYLYKFVSAGRIDGADPAGQKDILDRGTLYAARFNDDGTLDWLPLVHGSGPLTAANGFESQAEVLIQARRAADLKGATPMDRPEDVEPSPVTGRVYVMLTKNTERKPSAVDAANPRGPNPFGHVIEILPPGVDGARDHATTRDRWNILILGGSPVAGGGRYPAQVTENGWLATPDNCAFDPRGRLWMTSDQGWNWHRTGTADGLYGCDLAGPGRGLTRHFCRAPVGAEFSGPTFTPDGRTLFLSVQHPGADGVPRGVGLAYPATRWPDFQADLPPRPAVVAITRRDRGPIGA